MISLLRGSLSNIYVTLSFEILLSKDKSAPPAAKQLSKNKLSIGPSTTNICFAKFILSSPNTFCLFSSNLMVTYFGTSFPKARP